MMGGGGVKSCLVGHCKQELVNFVVRFHPLSPRDSVRKCVTTKRIKTKCIKPKHIMTKRINAKHINTKCIKRQNV